MLSQQDLHDAFMELGTRARADGIVLEIAVYRGPPLMLASNFRVATRDIDAVALGEQSAVNRYADAVAQARR